MSSADYIKIPFSGYKAEQMPAGSPTMFRRDQTSFSASSYKPLSEDDWNVAKGQVGPDKAIVILDPDNGNMSQSVSGYVVMMRSANALTNPQMQSDKEQDALAQERKQMEAGYGLAINSWAASEFPNPAYRESQNIDFTFLTSGSDPLIASVQCMNTTATKPYVAFTAPASKAKSL